MRRRRFLCATAFVSSDSSLLTPVVCLAFLRNGFSTVPATASAPKKPSSRAVIFSRRGFEPKFNQKVFMKLKVNYPWFVAVAVVVLAGLACRQVPQSSSAVRATKPIYYTCPMHPSVKVAAAGDCPLCSMKLVPAFSETDSGSAAPCGAKCCAAPASTAKP